MPWKQLDLYFLYCKPSLGNFNVVIVKHCEGMCTEVPVHQRHGSVRYNVQGHSYTVYINPVINYIFKKKVIYFTKLTSTHNTCPSTYATIWSVGLVIQIHIQKKPKLSISVKQYYICMWQDWDKLWCISCLHPRVVFKMWMWRYMRFNGQLPNHYEYYWYKVDSICSLGSLQTL